jgi:hypothetical protein
VADILLCFHCASADAEAIAEALRGAVQAPVHLRDERVLGRDFSDAGTGEQVLATLRRSAVELVVDEAATAALVATVEGARRRWPVRWLATPIAARGRIG